MTLRRLLLKICHQTNLNYISVASDTSLEQLMETVMERFKLSGTGDFELCVGSGEVVDQQFYSNFVSAFPSSNCILYVRTVFVNPAKFDQSNSSAKEDHDVREYKIATSPDISFYKNRSLLASGRKMWAAPLKRQNCFINVFPENQCEYPRRRISNRSTRVFRIRN